MSPPDEKEPVCPTVKWLLSLRPRHRKHASEGREDGVADGIHVRTLSREELGSRSRSAAGCSSPAAAGSIAGPTGTRRRRRRSRRWSRAIGERDDEPARGTWWTTDARGGRARARRPAEPAGHSRTWSSPLGRAISRGNWARRARRRTIRRPPRGRARRGGRRRKSARASCVTSRGSRADPGDRLHVGCPPTGIDDGPEHSITP